MLLYRSNDGGRAIGMGTMRLCTIGALVAYPAGALILAWGDDLMSAVAGFGLILLALILVGVIMGASVQRIVGERPDRLDEYELKLRARAMSASYAGFTGLVLVAIIYAAIASDKGFWLPSSYEEYNGLFWGAFLYASILPSAVLAFQLDPADVRSEV